MAKVVFTQNTNETAVNRVPAREMTDDQLKVVVFPALKIGASTSNKVADVAIQLGTTYSCQLSVWRTPGSKFVSVSGNRDYTNVTIPADVISAICERIEKYFEEVEASEISLVNISVFPLKNPRPSMQGFMAVQTTDYGTMWSFMYGVSSKTGKPYVMQSRINPESNKKNEFFEVGEDGWLEGRYNVKVEEGKILAKKADARFGNSYPSQAIYEAVLAKAYEVTGFTTGAVQVATTVASEVSESVDVEVLEEVAV